MEKTEKIDEKQEEVKEETNEEVKAVEQPVVLGQVPTEYSLVYRTPDGVFDQQEYLAWIGNKIVKMEQGLLG